MCTKPLKLEDRIVACGQCIECLIKRSQEWAFRLEQEVKTASSGVFLTLTYDNANALWVDDEEGNLLTTLWKPDWQKFMKRLRHHQGPLKNKNDWKEKLRFFMCGEYGPETGRAHYHAIIFNLKKSVIEKLDQHWNKGFIKVDEVTPKSIRYVTNYMLLKDQYKEEVQQKPFTLMSRRPIIGCNYIVNNYTNHIDGPSDTKGKLIHNQKNRRNLYKSYERKIFTEKDMEEIRRHRELAYQAYDEDKRAYYVNKDPLDPQGAEIKERKHNQYIKTKRSKQTKRKL